MVLEDLTDDNAELWAAKHYEKPNAVMAEFQEDYQRVLYIKRLLHKFYMQGVLKDRLLMNHIIIMGNVFGIESATRLLFLKMDERDLTVVKPFLIVLGFLPKTVRKIRGQDIETDLIALDKITVDVLRGSVMGQDNREADEQSKAA